jgi:fluoroquinolone transport system ATP-binding protein
MHTARELCDRVAFIVDGELPVIASPRELVLEHGKARLAVEHREDGQVMRSEFELSGLGDNPAFLSLIKEKNIETIHTEEATLEDVFIEVTGRRLA